MSIKPAYELACRLTKQYLLGNILKKNAVDVFTASGVVLNLSARMQDIAKIALVTLLHHSEMPTVHESRVVEEYTPQIKIPNPNVQRGFSVVVIDGSQARAFVLADARNAAIV